MKKYLIVARNTFDEITTYRINFVMWRLRVILQLFSTYILWLAISSSSSQIFGYNQSLILTYILGTSFLSAIVLSTRTHEIGENINSGNLSIFLIRPLSYFKYWFARDLGDKIMNIAFFSVEITLFFFILKPPFYIQTDLLILFYTVLAIILATLNYFFFSTLLGFIGFWSPEIWAPRFLSYIIIFFFAGGMFPLDMLPSGIHQTMLFLPFSYLLYFPAKVYLGQLSVFEIFKGLSISLIWIFLLYQITLYIWHLGLKKFGAEGR